MHLSASAQILTKTVTLEIGLAPCEVSFCNTTASVPSRTAQVISDASVRDGLSFLHIDSRTYDAVMIGFAAILAFSIIHFYAMKTFSAGISIARSLRDIMIPSAAARISS